MEGQHCLETACKTIYYAYNLGLLKQELRDKAN